MLNFLLDAIFQSFALITVAALFFVAYRRVRSDNRYIALTIAVVLGSIAVVNVASDYPAYRRQQARDLAFRQMSSAQHLAEAKRMWDGGSIVDSTNYDELLKQIFNHVVDVSPQEPGRSEFLSEISAAVKKQRDRYAESDRRAAAYRAKGDAYKARLDGARQAVDAAEKACPGFLDAPIGRKPCPQLAEAKNYLEAVEAEAHDTP